MPQKHAFSVSLGGILMHEVAGELFTAIFAAEFKKEAQCSVQSHLLALEQHRTDVSSVIRGASFPALSLVQSLNLNINIFLCSRVGL